jgi:uncharacterized protein with von Willebrand factor type A (vWA) domain
MLPGNGARDARRNGEPRPDGGGRAGGEPSAGLVRGGPYRYARWDDSQRLPDWSADDVMDHVTDELLASGDLASALARLMARGAARDGDERTALTGLRELLSRLARAREQVLGRYQLGNVLGDVRRELDEVVSTERRGLERRLAGADGAMAGDGGSPSLRDVAADLAARRQAELDGLPPDVGRQIRALQDYDFMEPEARSRFDDLLERLHRQVLDSYFSGLTDAIRSTTPEQLAANREMVRELNGLLQERLAGGDPDVSDFLSRHGSFFPGAKTLDDIIDQLTRRMSTMQSLMASLDHDQRHELQQLMDGLLRDDRLRWDLAQLAATLDQLLPDGLGQRVDFHGSESLTLDGALGQLAQLQRIDQLAEQLAGVNAPAALESIDLDELTELLGEQAADDVSRLQALARRLEEAGYAERRGGSLELTPRGMRRIGQRVLDELFGRLQRDVFGSHAVRDAGGGGERGEGSRAYEFGQPFELDLRRTLANALAREENARRLRATTSHPRSTAARPQLELAPADFEVHETEVVSRAATVLLVDMSRSMLLRGCFLAAKKVAIALDTLIRTRYPRDELHVVGFAYYAREIRAGGLAGLTWHGYEYGTNLQHGLMLARRLLAHSHAANREIIVITDGEPTAHFEAGQVEFSYPPTRRTVVETLREVSRCTKGGITINTFMLERSRALADFVEQMTRLNRGRAFYATPERLGEYVLVDYVDRRNRAR